MSQVTARDIKIAFLSRPYPSKFDFVFNQLEDVIKTINEVRAQARTKASEG